MNALTLFFAQAVPVTSPSPTPRAGVGGGGGGSVIDLGPILKAIKPETLFGDLLLIVGGKLEEALSNIWDTLWRGGINVFTQTAPELTYAFPPVADLMLGMRVLVAASPGWVSCSPHLHSPVATCSGGARISASTWVVLGWPPFWPTALRYGSSTRST